MSEQAPLIPRIGAGLLQASREPLTPTVKRGLLALVIFFHVGGGWALTQVEPVKLIVGDIAPMEVRMVPAEQAAEPEVENAEPPPPVEIKPIDLAAIVDPPPPDLPPPEFPIAKIDIPPPPDLPPPVIPKPEKKVEHKPEVKPAPKRPPAPRTVSDSQVGYLVQPRALYPTRSRKAGEQGTAIAKVLIDPSGRPAQVLLQKSSGHPALDEAALSAVRAAQFRPYVENGVPQPVWVLAPIKFELQ